MEENQTIKDTTTSESQQTQPQAEQAQLPTPAPSPSDSEFPKEDWFLTRVKAPEMSTKSLFEVYGTDGFGEFKNKEDYWEDKKVQELFANTYGSEAKMRFDQAYDNSKKEFANFQLGNYQRSQTGHELIRDDLSSLRFDATLRFENMAGTMMQGMDWSAPTKDYRENFSSIKIKELDEHGVESYVIKEYSPELLKELENDPSFGGLAYSDAFFNLDPNEGVNGLYFNSIYDGRVLDETTGEMKDVRNDQVVSRWDLDTGPTSVLGMFDVNLGRFFKNNKLEADGVLDYAKILVKAPMNMAVNVMDTAVQLTRAAVAGGYGVADMFTDDDLDVRASETYKWLTTKGVRLKGNVTSMSREAIQDGFFGSLEAALVTTADVALQIALAGALGRAGAGAVQILDKGLQGKALQQAQTRAAEVFVRGTLTAMAAKDSYNEAIENGYSTKEASLITGAMGVALWKATKYASYIFGDYEAKILRQNIKTAMQAEQQGMLKTLFASVEETAADAGEKKAKYALASMQKAVANVFGKITKSLPANKMVYVARQEGFEEMTEELFQDGVKQAASAYGYLINNAQAAGKGRYLSIFDDGYFKDAALRYATSGVAGAMGGPMGMVGNHVTLSPITSTSSLTDILMNGEKEELISVLQEMKADGSLGPQSLSTEYNAALEAFEPIVKGSGSESLADMVYNNYMHDINVVDTFINQGMFGTAKEKIKASSQLKDFVDNNAMRKDYVKLMGSLLDFHNKTGISMSVYQELDDMPEGELSTRIPEVLRKSQDDIKEKRRVIEELKESIKNIAPVSEKATEKEEKPKTEEKKENKKVIGETEESKLTRLEKEVKLSSTVSEKDIVTMLSNYRKIRAISTGIASEYYLLQNDIADNTMLGAKYNREAKYAELGEEPFKDMLIAMRLRSLEDEKIHAHTAIKAAELEAKILEITSADLESIEKLTDILKKSNYSLLSEKALKAIAKLYSSVDIKEIKNAFDANHEDSVFEKDIDGKASENDMIHLYREIVGLTRDNDPALEDDTLGLEITPALVKKFFKEVSKDIRKVNVPIWEYSDDGLALGYSDINLIDAIKENGTTRLRRALAVSGDIVTDVKSLHDNANQTLALGGFYKNEPFKRQGINSLFKKGVGTSLSKETLVGDGLSVVRMLMDSSYEGIYTYSDTNKMDDVLSQIDVRLEMSKVLSTLTEAKEGKASHYLRMLADFRKNVLNIIDIKYKYGSKQDTEIEEHSYKDYSVTSDFFVDFIYDPISFMEIIKKDPQLHTDEDINVLNNIKTSQALVRPTLVSDKLFEGLSPDEYITVKPTVDDLIIMEVPIDEEVLFAELDTRYDKDFKKAAAFIESAEVIVLPATVLGSTDEGSVPLFFDGVTKLMVAKWLFSRTRGVIADVASKATALPYIQSKDNDNDFTIKTFRNLIESVNIPILKTLIDIELPDFELAIRKGIETFSSNEIGAMNIALEGALFRIYNNIGKKPLLEEESVELNKMIDSHILAINNRVGKAMFKNEKIEAAVEDVRALSILTGAVTTDFTPFYSKFKRDIENMSSYDRIVVAAQEHSAKYAGAYIYSAKYKQMADRWTKQRLLHVPYPTISAVYITGVAGSGKSSSAIQLGLKLAVEILEDSGAANTAVLPVATYDSQIKIISDSVGDLSKGLKGISVSSLLDLLKNAVHSKNEEAIATLATVGIITIDEATYVEAVSLDDSYTADLEQINTLIKEFNNSINPTGHEIGLVLMGDPKQSGASRQSKDGILHEVHLEVRRAHPIAYMNFSFRSRNSSLIDSLYAIGQTIEKGTGDGMYNLPSTLVLEEGTKYGTTAGKLYGMNFIEATDKSSSEEFFKILNDDLLVSNIEENIRKNKEVNAALAPGEPEVPFTVLLAPSDIVGYGSTPSKMKALSQMEGNEKYFNVVAATMVGGSEANYVIGELANSENKSKGEVSFLKTVSKSLNTMATRAFDYALILNRNDSIVVPVTSASVQLADGLVIIPDNKLDGAAKARLKQNYLEIFKDITSDTTIAVKVPPVVIPGEPYEIPKDTFAANFKNIAQFTSGDKALLSTRGSLETFKNLSEEDTMKLTEYLEDAKALLSQEDAANVDIRDAFVENMDAIAIELKGKISQQTFEELVGLQVFSLGLIDDAVVSNIMIAHIDVALATLAMDPDIMSHALLTNMTVAQYVGKAEVSVNDASLEGTHSALFKAALGKDVDQEASDKYEALVEIFAKDLIPGDEAPNLDNLNDPDDTIPALLDAIILARATFVASNLPISQPDIDVNMIANILTAYEAWVTSLDNPDITKALLEQFSVGATSATVNILPEFMELFTLGFNSESVKKALYDATLMVKARKDAEVADKSIYTDAIANMAKLKVKLGIPSNVVDAMKLYAAIGNVDSAFRKKIYGAQVTAEINAELTDIITISNLWNLLYKGTSATFGGDKNNEYGVGFMDRNLDHKETLQDYIDAANRGEGVYTVGVTKFNLDSGVATALASNTSKKQVVLTAKEALGLFNYNDNNTNPPKGTALRVVKRAKGAGYEVDVFVMATTSSTNYVLSQMNTTDNSGAAMAVMAELMEAVDKSADTFSFGNAKILDIEMPGNVKDFMYTRPGGIVTLETISKEKGGILNDNYLVAPVKGADGEYRMLTAADLIGKVNTSGTIYVQTYKPVAGENKAVGNLRGESFFLYSANQSTSLDAKDIVDNMKQGRGMTTKTRIKDTAGVISTQLGLMKVDIKAPLQDLAKVLRANAGITMGQFVSHFSLALQAHFIDVASTFKVGQEVDVYVKENFVFTQDMKAFILGSAIGATVDYSVDGAIRTFTITDALANYARSLSPGSIFTYPLGDVVTTYTFNKEAASLFSEMDKDLNTHYSAAGKDYRAEVDVVLEKMKSNPELKAVLDDFAKAYMINKLRMDTPSKTIKYDIIYRSSTGGYIFNVNEYLRYHPDSILMKLNTLTDVANYTLKPSILKGETVYAGTINQVFKKELPEALKISTLGIKVPSIIVSESGVASIRTAIRMAGTVNSKETIFTSAQYDLLVELDSLISMEPAVINNKLLSLGVVKLDTMLTEMDSLEMAIKGDATHAEVANNIVALRPLVREAARILKESGIENISPNEYLSEYAQSTDYDSSFRQILAEILIHYKGPTDVLENTLESLSLLGEAEEGQVVESLKQYVDDEEMLTLLNNCKFN